MSNLELEGIEVDIDDFDLKLPLYGAVKELMDVYHHRLDKRRFSTQADVFDMVRDQIYRLMLVDLFERHGSMRAVLLETNVSRNKLEKLLETANLSHKYNPAYFSPEKANEHNSK